MSDEKAKSATHRGTLEEPTLLASRGATMNWVGPDRWAGRATCGAPSGRALPDRGSWRCSPPYAATSSLVTDH